MNDYSKKQINIKYVCYFKKYCAEFAFFRNTDKT